MKYMNNLFLLLFVIALSFTANAQDQKEAAKNENTETTEVTPELLKLQKEVEKAREVVAKASDKYEESQRMLSAIGGQIEILQRKTPDEVLEKAYHEKKTQDNFPEYENLQSEKKSLESKLSGIQEYYNNTKTTNKPEDNEQLLMKIEEFKKQLAETEQALIAEAENVKVKQEEAKKQAEIDRQNAGIAEAENKAKEIEELKLEMVKARDEFDVARNDLSKANQALNTAIGKVVEYKNQQKAAAEEKKGNN